MITEHNKKAAKRAAKTAARFLRHFGDTSLINTLSTNGIESRYTYPMKPAQWQMLHISNSNGHSVYFTVNETNGKGRTAKDIIRCRAVFVDDDKPRKAPRTDFAIEPSLIVKTSKVVTGNKYHYYWLTSTKHFDEWERVMLGMIDVYDTDISIHDVSRIMRLPGYKNTKNNTECEVVYESDNYYDWLEILSAFPPVTRERRLALLDKDESAEFNEHALCDRFRNPTRAGDISNSVNSLIMHMAMEGRSAFKIRTYIKQLYDTIDTATLQDTETIKRYDACYKQVGKWIKSAKKKSEKARQKVAIIDAPVKAQFLVADMEVPQFDKESIPKTVYNAADQVGRFLANGTAPAIISAMSIACALLSKSVRIHEIGEDKVTACSSGIIVAMETGTRKTEVYKLMNKPFIEYEVALQKAWEKGKHRIQATVFVYQEKIRALELTIKRGIKKGMNDKELQSHILAMAEYNAKIEKLQLKRPVLMVKDITEEAVIPKLADNNGALAVISDDSRNIIKNILGRYSTSTTSEGWLIDGIGGTTIKYNRTKNEGTEIVVEEPCLNVYLMVQPDMAIKLKEHEVYKRSGLAARVPIYFYPIDPIDIVKNSDRSRRLDNDIMQKYYDVLTGICHRRLDNPLIIKLSKKAEKRFNMFNDKFVTLLQTVWKGEYRRTNKIVTQAVIMSTVMAALDDPEFAKVFRSTTTQYTLSRKHANMGCKYVEQLYDGMIKSTTGLDSMEAVDAAIKFAQSLSKYYERGKIFEGFVNTSHLQNTFSSITKENREDVIQLLVDNGWLLTEVSDKVGDLNNGFPPGKAKIGDTIYHLNVDEVNKLLREMALAETVRDKL